MTGPRLKSALYGTNCPNMNPFYLMVGKISALVRELVLYFFYILHVCVLDFDLQPHPGVGTLGSGVRM